MTLVMMSLPLAGVFQCLFTFALVSSSCADWQKIDSSVDGEPQGNWRQDVVVRSPPFPTQLPVHPGELAHRLDQREYLLWSKHVCGKSLDKLETAKILCHTVILYLLSF